MPLRHRVASAVVSVGIALVGGAASAQTAGWTYTTNITTDSGFGAARRTSMAMQVQVTPQKMRIGIVQASGALGAAEGTYQIFNFGDSSAVMVTPAQKMAMTMSVPESMAMTGGGLKTSGHVTTTDVVDLGAGERILGHATRHFRVASTSTVEMHMGSESCTQVKNSETEMWIAPDADFSDAATLAKSLGEMGLPSNGMTIDAPASKLPTGATLRTVIKSSGFDAQGAPQTVTTTMETAELTRGPISDAAFAIPADYKLMDMRNMMPTLVAALPAGMMDSLMTATNSKMLTAMCGSAPKR